jgi:hypothetical protein
MIPRAALFLAAGLLVGGCAEIAPPSPGEVLESPFGKGPLRIGMSRDEVRDLWGEPDQIDEKEPDRWGTSRQTWTYEAKFPGAVPVDVGYASKTKILEFEGENLVAFHE